MLRLVYDYQIFCWQKYGGVSRYIYEIATRLSLENEFNVQILAMAYLNQYLKCCKPDSVLGFRVYNISKTGKIIETINKQLSKVWLHYHPPDIVHETFYSSKRIVPQQTKIVLTVHDMIDEKFNPDSEIVRRKAEAISRADRIICVSQNTKRDLMEILPVDPGKIDVVYHGCSLSEGDLAKEPNHPSFGFPYILYVGERYGYKNFNRLLEAYASSKILKKDFKLVCFGGYPMVAKELEQAERLGISPGHLLYFSGDDALLKRLYQEAAAFVYPSLYEGFGIPPLEAMTLGCPVVCSNISSIPEVVGQAAELFNPFSSENIATALETVLYSVERTENLRILGKERAKLFSWEECARQTKEVYLSLV